MDLDKKYYDSDGIKRNILEMVKIEPEWAANRIQEGEHRCKGCGAILTPEDLCVDCDQPRELDNVP